MSAHSLIPSATDIEGFRIAQRLAYACAEAIHAKLQPGVTEREVAARMKTWLADHGATDCLHQPFVWFGPRTAFRGLIDITPLRGFNPAFFPGSARLEADMPFILDCAPALNGCAADIGYTGVLGENTILDQLMDDLADHRQIIMAMIRERRLMSEVSQAVDALCVKQGVEPRHHAYPFSVLAHRVEKLPARPLTPRISVGRFGIRSVLSLGHEIVQGRREGWSPLWASRPRSAHLPVPGLWAVEPHLGFRNVGAKFEELLVITETDAFWLDDDVPHVRRWLERGVIGAPGKARPSALTVLKAPTPIAAPAATTPVAATSSAIATTLSATATPQKPAKTKTPRVKTGKTQKAAVEASAVGAGIVTSDVTLTKAAATEATASKTTVSKKTIAKIDAAETTTSETVPFETMASKITTADAAGSIKKSAVSTKTKAKARVGASKKSSPAKSMEDAVDAKKTADSANDSKNAKAGVRLDKKTTTPTLDVVAKKPVTSQTDVKKSTDKTKAEKP